MFYKQLWTVERTFRTTKSLLETRPIYHKLDQTIRGHVACSFLGLVLKKELEDRLAAADKGARASWPAVIADLDSLTETEVEQDGKRSCCAPPRAPAPATAVGPRRRPAADHAPIPGRLIHTQNPNVVPRRHNGAPFSCDVNNLVQRTVEDQLEKLAGTRVAGSVLTRQSAIGKWAATYTLTQPDNARHREHRGLSVCSETC